MAMPIRLDDDGLQVAVSDQPSVTRPRAAHAVDRTPDPLRARTGVRHPMGHRQQLPGHRRRGHPGGGLRGSRGHAARPTRPTKTEVVADDAPIVQVVTRILTQAKRDRASDVHIEPSQDVVRVRFRIDGALKEVLMLPADHGRRPRQPDQDHGGHEHRRAAAAAGRPAHHADRREGHRRPGLDRRHHLGREVRACGSSTRTGPCCASTTSACRPTRTRPSRSLVKAPFGMVLCAGPTGSGKTTTLYATLSEVADPTQERHDDRGPGRVHLPVHQPDSDQRAGGPHLRHRAEVHPAPGPRRDPRRRDP